MSKNDNKGEKYKSLIWLWYKINHTTVHPQKGNTLIIAMSLGLLLVIATSISLFTSSQQKTNVQSGEYSQRAMAVAELGVTRVHDFLARNSTLAEFPLSDWEAKAGTTQTQGTFANTTSSNSTCTTLSSAGGSTTMSSVVGKFKTTGDTVVANPTTATDFREGGFKVLDYRLADANLNPVSSVDASSVSVGQVYGHGILTVQSEINASANSASDLFGNNGTPRASVEVAIPLIRATASVPFPGVWISDQQIGSPSNSIINATLLVPNCNNMGLQIMPGNNVILSSMTFPPLPTPPSASDPKYYDLGNITSSLTLPRGTDQPIDIEQVTHNGTTYNVQVYKYRVNNITLNGGEKITIVPGRKVILHLYGNINIGGSQVIDNRCVSVSGQYNCDSTTNVVTYNADPSNPSVFRRENLAILGYGVNTGGVTSQQPSICLSGGAEVFGFVFAPDYAVGAAGTGGGNGFTGAVWARMFNPPSTCGSNTGQVVVVQDITDWSSLESLGLTVGNIPPRIGNIARWQRQEAN